MKAHRVVKIEEDETAPALVVHLELGTRVRHFRQAAEGKKTQHPGGKQFYRWGFRKKFLGWLLLEQCGDGHLESRENVVARKLVRLGEYPHVGEGTVGVDSTSPRVDDPYEADADGEVLAEFLRKPHHGVPR